MAGFDTSLGGDRAFPVTSWGLIHQLNHSSGDRQAGLERLCELYWKAIYCFLRQALRRSDADAKDLTQEFFLWLAEGDVLAKASGDGPFRPFLKAVLRNFVRNRDAKSAAQKRGGGRTHLPIDEALVLVAEGSSPEEAFDHAWVDQLLEGAIEQARAKSTPEQFAVFEAYELAAADAQPTYAELAERLGLAKHTVRNHLAAVRDRVREATRSALRETVATGAQFESEWRQLFEGA